MVFEVQAMAAAVFVTKPAILGILFAYADIEDMLVFSPFWYRRRDPSISYQQAGIQDEVPARSGCGESLY